MNSTTVTSKGQVTIPAEIRADLGIATGDKLVFFKKLDGGLGIHLRRLRQGSGRGLLSRKGRVPLQDMSPASAPEGYDPGGLAVASRSDGSA